MLWLDVEMNQAQSYWSYGKSKYVNFMDPQWIFTTKRGSIDASFFWHQCSTHTFQTSLQQIHLVGGSNASFYPGSDHPVIGILIPSQLRRFAQSRGRRRGFFTSCRAPRDMEPWKHSDDMSWWAQITTIWRYNMSLINYIGCFTNTSDLLWICGS